MKHYVLDAETMNTKATDSQKEDIWAWIKHHGIEPNTVQELTLEPKSRMVTFSLVTGVKWDEQLNTPVFDVTTFPLEIKSHPSFVDLCKVEDRV